MDQTYDYKKYCVDEAEKISGWMIREELEWLFDAAIGKKLIVEFGTWHGRSASVLLDGGSGVLVCCDSWTTNRGLIWGPEHTREGLPFDVFFTRFGGICEAGDIIPCVIDLANPVLVDCLVSRFGGQADMVFIDADHSCEGVTRDIATARRLIKPGGLICGHDYGEGDWPGVREAVDAAFAVVDNPVHTIWVGRDE